MYCVYYELSQYQDLLPCNYGLAVPQETVIEQKAGSSNISVGFSLWPSYASAHNNLGTLVLASGRAEHHFLQALKYNRDHVNAHYNLAKLYRYHFTVNYC